MTKDDEIPIPRQLYDFLMGAGQLNGVGFGDRPASKPAFWWRNELRACADRARRAPDAAVAWQRKHPSRGWIPVAPEDIPHYRKQKQSIRPLYAILPSVVWPDFVAPAKYENPCEGWEDPALPDFRLIWQTARECGYSIGLHGSMKRDVDLIAAPWTDSAQSPEKLIAALCRALNARQIGDTEQKPLGRVATTLNITDSYSKPIDLSICPALATPPSQDLREVREEIDREHSKVTGDDGYNYAAGHEYGLRRALMIVDAALFMQPSDEIKRRGSIEFVQGILEECWDDGAEAAAAALVDRHALTAAALPPEGDAEVLDDESLRAQIGAIGNEVHNLSCQYQHNERLAESLADIRSRLWSVAKQAPAQAAEIARLTQERDEACGERELWESACRLDDDTLTRRLRQANARAAAAEARIADLEELIAAQHEDVVGRTAKLLYEKDSKIVAAEAKAEELAKENASLREELACTYEELIDHNGDSLDDYRANRVGALRTALKEAYNGK